MLEIEESRLYVYADSVQKKEELHLSSGEKLLLLIILLVFSVFALFLCATIYYGLFEFVNMVNGR